MSQGSITDFLHAVQHSYSLRSKVKECKNDLNIIEVAYKYGFRITKDDLKEYDVAQKFQVWFKKSKINPIKNNAL